MILDKFVEVEWHSRNKNYYLKRGYVFTRVKDRFLVKTKDLINCSKSLIHVKCDVCNKNRYIEYLQYNKSIKNQDYYACSIKCCHNKKIRTNLSKYGYKYPAQNSKIKEKTKEFNLRKYGVTYPIQLPKFREKRNKNNLIKYGVEQTLKLNYVREKIKKTNIKKYGEDNPLKNEAIKNRIKQTNLKKYGFEYSQQNKAISDKMINTVIKNYGKIYFKYIPRYNLNSIIYLDLLSEKLNLSIQHALNGGEKKFIKYWVDGYISNHNICIEWDEKYHSMKKTEERDINREQYLKENFGCEIIRINQEEFLEDTENQIEMVCNKINDIIKQKHGKNI